jgi:hypothetical protein
VSLLGVLPSLVKMSSINASKNLLNNCCPEQNMNKKKVLIGAMRIRFKIENSIIPRHLKIPIIIRIIGKDLDHTPYTIY